MVLFDGDNEAGPLSTKSLRAAIRDAWGVGRLFGRCLPAHADFFEFVEILPIAG
jgi:hypothetical protein